MRGVYVDKVIKSFSMPRTCYDRVSRMIASIGISPGVIQGQRNVPGKGEDLSRILELILELILEPWEISGIFEKVRLKFH